MITGGVFLSNMAEVGDRPQGRADAHYPEEVRAPTTRRTTAAATC